MEITDRVTIGYENRFQAYTVYFTPLDEQQISNDAYKQWDKIIVQSSDNYGFLRLNKETYDILPNRLYRIRISATNDLSEGPASEPVTIRTESGGKKTVTLFFYAFFILQYFHELNIVFKFGNFEL